MEISLVLSVLGLVISIIALIISSQRYNLSKHKFALDWKKKQLLADSLIRQMGLRIEPISRDMEAVADFQEKMKGELTFEDNMALSEILLDIDAEIKKIQSDLRLDLAKLGYSLDEIVRKIGEKRDRQTITNNEQQDVERKVEILLRGIHRRRLKHLQDKILRRYTKSEAKKLGFILNKDGSITEIDT